MAVRQTAWDADVVVAIGTRMTGAPNLGYTVPGENQRFVHVHPDPNEVGVRFQTDSAIVADAALFLDALAMHNVPPAPADRAAWCERAHAAYIQASEVPTRVADDGIDFAYVIDAMNELLPPDAVITSDAGNFMSWMHHRFRFRRTNLLIGSEIGAMGMGIPAAVAASLRLRPLSMRPRRLKDTGKLSSSTATNRASIRKKEKSCNDSHCCTVITCGTTMPLCWFARHCATTKARVGPL